MASLLVSEKKRDYAVLKDKLKVALVAAPQRAHYAKHTGCQGREATIRTPFQYLRDSQMIH